MSYTLVGEREHALVARLGVAELLLTHRRPEVGAVGAGQRDHEAGRGQAEALGLGDAGIVEAHVASLHHDFVNVGGVQGGIGGIVEVPAGGLAGDPVGVMAGLPVVEDDTNLRFKAILL